MHSPRKYDHNRPQGRLHEKVFEFFQTHTKKNAAKVGTEKEDEKKESLVSMLL